LLHANGDKDSTPMELTQLSQVTMSNQLIHHPVPLDSASGIQITMLLRPPLLHQTLLTHAWPLLLKKFATRLLNANGNSTQLIHQSTSQLNTDAKLLTPPTQDLLLLMSTAWLLPQKTHAMNQDQMERSVLGKLFNQFIKDHIHSSTEPSATQLRLQEPRWPRTNGTNVSKRATKTNATAMLTFALGAMVLSLFQKKISALQSSWPKIGDSLKDALILKTNKLALINVNGIKERLSDQVNQTSNKELISSEPTSAIHQLLSTGTINLDNAFDSKTNKLAESMDKDNASGLLEKNFHNQTSVVQSLFQIMSMTS